MSFISLPARSAGQPTLLPRNQSVGTFGKSESLTFLQRFFMEETTLLPSISHFATAACMRMFRTRDKRTTSPFGSLHPTCSTMLPQTQSHLKRGGLGDVHELTYEVSVVFVLALLWTSTRSRRALGPITIAQLAIPRMGCRVNPKLASAERFLSEGTDS